MTFSNLAEYFSALEKTTLRLKITEILAEILNKVSLNEVDKICYLSLGRLAPLYAGIEFNLAEKLMIKAISQAFNLEEKEIKKIYKSLGDLGDVVYYLKGGKEKKGEKNFSVEEIYQRLQEIAQESGEGSVERKISKMANLIIDLDPLSAKYTVRIPLGRLRLGFSELTILDALSWMLVGDKRLRGEIESAYNVLADVGKIAQEIKKQKSGLPQKEIEEKIKEKLKEIKPQLGVPIMPSLCQRLPTPEEMIKKMGKVAAEPKFDGTRLQLHWQKGGKVWIFTRNLENVTTMFPDIVEASKKEIKANQVILDGEAIGYDPKSGKFLPFQETIKRKRKYEVDQKAKEIPLKYFVFDILYKDGKSLLNLPLKKRREILNQVLKKDNQRIVLTPQIITEDPNELRKFHDQQIKAGLEGAVVKKWQSFYQPGRRGYNWVKFKAEKKGKKGGGLADTLDCLVMGLYKGKGKRASFGVGAFLVGVKKSEKVEEFLTISKIGTGLSDEQWKELEERGEKLKAVKKPEGYKVDKNLTPDIWLIPSLVVEVEADNITLSPVHTAGMALRFPRLLRFRDDKFPQQVTTLKEVKKLYEMQTKI
ncbi:MAG: ATP-dependent DNA ligase [Microgenomates group bacterium]